MGPLVVVEFEVAVQAMMGVLQRAIGIGIDLLVFDRPPQPFHEDIVMRPAPPIHADLNTGLRQATGESGAGELGAPWSV